MRCADAGFAVVRPVPAAGLQIERVQAAGIAADEDAAADDGRL